MTTFVNNGSNEYELEIKKSEDLNEIPSVSSLNLNNNLTVQDGVNEIAKHMGCDDKDDLNSINSIIIEENQLDEKFIVEKMDSAIVNKGKKEIENCEEDKNYSSDVTSQVVIDQSKNNIHHASAESIVMKTSMGKRKRRLSR